MKSLAESNARPGAENSRRDFLQKIGTLAAAAPLAATPAAKAAPSQAMPMVKFGNRMVSRLIIGCNTLGGLSHLSRMIDNEMKAWNTPERLLADFRHASDLGINCVESPRPQFIEAVNQMLGPGKMLFTARGNAKLGNETERWPWPDPKEIAKRGSIGIHHVGAGEAGTDGWWRKGQLDRVRDYCKMVRDTGVAVCVTSHRPEVFYEIESQGWDVDYYMTCMYKYGRTPEEWKKSFASNPEMMPAELWYSKEGTSEHYGGETSFAKGDRAEMLKFVKTTKKPCMVYKILASGRLCEKEEYVEAAFKEVFESIKPTDAVVVGMWSKQEDQYFLNSEYVRRYGQVGT
jgi:hypothetical protein